MPTHFSDSAKKNQSAVTSGTMHRSGLIYKSQPVQIYASRLHCGWIRMVRYVCWGQGPTRLISSSPFEEDNLGTTGRAYLTVAVKSETRRVVRDFHTSRRHVRLLFHNPWLLLELFSSTDLPGSPQRNDQKLLIPTSSTLIKCLSKATAYVRILITSDCQSTRATSVTNGTGRKDRSTRPSPQGASEWTLQPNG